LCKKQYPNNEALSQHALNCAGATGDQQLRGSSLKNKRKKTTSPPLDRDQVGSADSDVGDEMLDVASIAERAAKGSSLDAEDEMAVVADDTAVDDAGDEKALSSPVHDDAAGSASWMLPVVSEDKVAEVSQEFIRWLGIGSHTVYEQEVKKKRVTTPAQLRPVQNDIRFVF
jgi:hypothetical protein